MLKRLFGEHMAVKICVGEFVVGKDSQVYSRSVVVEVHAAHGVSRRPTRAAYRSPCGACGCRSDVTADIIAPDIVRNLCFR